MLRVDYHKASGAKVVEHPEIKNLANKLELKINNKEKGLSLKK